MADVFTYFEDLHKMPEIGMHEFKTSAYIADHLKKMGYEVLPKYDDVRSDINRDRFLAFALIWTH